MISLPWDIWKWCPIRRSIHFDFVSGCEPEGAGGGGLIDEALRGTDGRRGGVPSHGVPALIIAPVVEVGEASANELPPVVVVVGVVEIQVGFDQLDAELAGAVEGVVVDETFLGGLGDALGFFEIVFITGDAI